MCGIFGWQFRPNNRPNLLQRTLLANALGRENVSRGKDSWGYYLLDRQEIRRGLGEIIGHTQPMGLSFCAFGHTRHATDGAKTVANAHPFMFGETVGAHNGVITNHFSLNNKRETNGLKKYEVDSMHLIDAIDTGLKATESLEGWGAVEWVNLRRPTEINICRMSGSADLHAFMGKEGIIWSSTESALRSAVKEAGLKGVLLKLDDNVVYIMHNGMISSTEDRIKLESSFRGGTYGSQYAGSQAATAHDLEEWRERIRNTPDARRKREERKNKAQSGVATVELNLCADCYADLDRDGFCPNPECKTDKKEESSQHHLALNCSK